MSEPPAVPRARCPHDARDILASESRDDSPGRGDKPPSIRKLNHGVVTNRVAERASEAPVSEREDISRLPPVAKTAHRIGGVGTTRASFPPRDEGHPRTKHGDKKWALPEVSHHNAQSARHISAPPSDVVLEKGPAPEMHNRARREPASARLLHDRGPSARVSGRGGTVSTVRKSASPRLALRGATGTHPTPATRSDATCAAPPPSHTRGGAGADHLPPCTPKPRVVQPRVGSIRIFSRSHGAASRTQRLRDTKPRGTPKLTPAAAREDGASKLSADAAACSIVYQFERRTAAEGGVGSASVVAAAQLVRRQMQQPLPPLRPQPPLRCAHLEPRRALSDEEMCALGGKLVSCEGATRLRSLAELALESGRTVDVGCYEPESWCVTWTLGQPLGSLADLLPGWLFARATRLVVVLE